MYGGNLCKSTTDTFLALPKQQDLLQMRLTNTLQHHTAAYLVLLSKDGLYVDIIAQYNGTKLFITPTMDTTIGGTLTLSGATTSISLQEGKTFLVQSNDDLTGFPASNCYAFRSQVRTNVPKSIA